MSNKMSTEQLYEEVISRFAENSPFSTAAAGLQGFQYLANVEDWFISLEMNRHKVLFLTATNRRLGTQLDRLPVATRSALDQYHFTLRRVDFDKWVQELVPTQEQPTVWELFIKVVEKQEVKVAPGKKQELWRSGERVISIVRETERDQLRLICKNGRSTLSLPLARWGRDHTSRNGDCKGIWMINADAKKHYASFVGEVRS